MDLLIFTPKTTPRVKYAVSVLFEEVLQLSVQIETDQALFEKAEAPLKISYTKDPVGGALHIASHGVLQETGINDLNIKVLEWNGLPSFFPVSSGVFPFDPLGTSFYLVSRYEEYLPHKRDPHQRFDPTQSLAFKNDFLHKPVVDHWAIAIQQELEKQFPAFDFPLRKYSFQPTIDVDNAYAYLEKGVVRTLGAIVRSILGGEWADLGKRISCLLGKEQDPFDTFDHFYELQKRYDLSPLYFFLVADYGHNDKNVPVSSKKFQSLMKGINDYAEVGVHPSYMSNEDPQRLRTEVKRLTNVLHTPIRKSRQHFLKLVLPETYRNLIDIELKEDYSMGYPSEFGFRAGICRPFWFYDLDREQVTELRVHPFCVMEATLKYYKNIGPEDAVEAMLPILKEVKTVGGVFSSLWHSESLSGVKEWAGWENVYEEMIQKAIPE